MLFMLSRAKLVFSARDFYEREVLPSGFRYPAIPECRFPSPRRPNPRRYLSEHFVLLLFNFYTIHLTLHHQKRNAYIT